MSAVRRECQRQRNLASEPPHGVTVKHYGNFNPIFGWCFKIRYLQKDHYLVAEIFILNNCSSIKISERRKQAGADRQDTAVSPSRVNGSLQLKQSRQIGAILINDLADAKTPQNRHFYSGSQLEM